MPRYSLWTQSTARMESFCNTVYGIAQHNSAGGSSGFSIIRIIFQWSTCLFTIHTGNTILMCKYQFLKSVQLSLHQPVFWHIWIIWKYFAVHIVFVHWDISFWSVKWQKCSQLILEHWVHLVATTPFKHFLGSFRSICLCGKW